MVKKSKSQEDNEWNIPVLSLNEIMAYSEYVPTKNENEHFRQFDRAQIEMIANQKLGQQSAHQSKNDIEFSRYKQDCRKRALEHAFDQIRMGGVEKKTVQELAEEHYNWLISIPQ